MSAKKTEDKTEGAKAKDESRDRIYFTVTPRLVWALAQDPHEYTLWGVVKDIAGEDGECILAREDLAVLAMMSEGMVSTCRDRLIKKRLLIGELKKDPGYPMKVWHLRIPDFWEANIRWARMYPKIKDRVAYKREQLAGIDKRSKLCSSCRDEFIPRGRRSHRCDSCQDAIEKERAKIYNESKKIRRELIESGSVCADCGSSSLLELHHKDGVLSGNENVEILCLFCHDKKHREDKKLRHPMTELIPKSSDDESPTPDDGALPPDDAKKNVFKEPLEKLKEEDLKNLFLKVPDLIFPDVKDLSNLERVSSELSASFYCYDGSAFIVSGLAGDRAEYYQDRYKRLFERALIGLLGQEIPVEFTGGDAVTV